LKIYVGLVNIIIKMIRDKNITLPALSLIWFLVFSHFHIDPPVEPPHVAVIKIFADKVYKNKQGHWEVQFKYGIKMIHIPQGTFLMGTPRGETGRERDEGPQHRVYLDGYWIAKYEVSQRLWDLIMKDRRSPSQSEERLVPANQLSWNDAQMFLSRLNRNTGLYFRLPTEAEWEKACRAGSETAQYAPLNKVAWYAGNSGNRLHPVGLKQPNAYGLFDMLGNVWEWCSDWYDNHYYSNSSYKNPQGPSKGSRRVVRGGGFAHGFSYLRSGHRNSLEPEGTRRHLGLRLVLPELTERGDGA
jgi:formylglycine-generating enzyme required for sulfatase activity